MHRFLMTELERGSSLRSPRSDKQEEAKCIFGPSVSPPTSYPSCSIRIGAHARGVLSFDLEALDRWYGVNGFMFQLSEKNVQESAMQETLQDRAGKLT